MNIKNDYSTVLFDSRLFGNRYNLKYRIDNNKTVFEDESVKQSPEFITYFDIQDIDLSNCTYDELRKVLTFAKESSTAFEYDEKLLDSLLPQDYSENQKCNYPEYFSELKYKYAQKGDMQLYFNLHKIVAASYWFMYNKDNPNIDRSITEDGFYINNVFENALDVMSVYYDSYTLGDSMIGIGNQVYTLKSYYAFDSTYEKPIIDVNVQVIDIDTNNYQYVPEIYSVDISELNLSQMNAIEMFAYLSYMDSKGDEDWYTIKGYYNQNHSFQKIIESEVFDYKNYEELKTATFNLYDKVIEAKKAMLSYDETEAHYDWHKNMDEEIRKTYSSIHDRIYRAKCIKLFDDILKYFR